MSTSNRRILWLLAGVAALASISFVAWRVWPPRDRADDLSRPSAQGDAVPIETTAAEDHSSSPPATSAIASAIPAALLRAAPEIGRPDKGYIGSAACQACHQDNYHSWHRTYHRTMTQLATGQAVRAPFDGVTLTNRGRVYHLERRGVDDFWVDMVDPDWDRRRLASGERESSDTNPPRVNTRVVMSTGSHHMQLYWVAGSHDKRHYMLPFMYIFADERWVPVEDSFIRPPHWGRLTQTWETSCINCHATAGQPGLVGATRRFEPRVAELGISCEACHGPARYHAEFHNSTDKLTTPVGVRPTDRIVNPTKLSHVRGSQVCGQCHAVFGFRDRRRWLREGTVYRPGDDLWTARGMVRHPAKSAQHTSHKLPLPIKGLEKEFLDTRFWADGMLRVSGRDFTGMIESPCYQRGKLSCFSCHSMHDADPNDQLSPGMETNKACLQCHQEMGDRLAEHTHHAPTSTGSLCYNCHMPHTVYGLLKGIRSHEISNPSLTESLEPVGRPNACNLCHLDKTLAWTGKHLQQWYSHDPIKLDTDQQQISAMLLWLTKGDAGQRALAAWHFSWPAAVKVSGARWAVPELAEVMARDPYAAVRYIAARTVRGLSEFETIQYDFVGSEKDRASAAVEVLNRWRQGPARNQMRFGPHLLLDAGRQIDQARLRQLIEARNDRPVDLEE